MRIPVKILLCTQFREGSKDMDKVKEYAAQFLSGSPFLVASWNGGRE
jgi:hypothetical protein